MPQVIELKDGSLVTPLTVFDAMEAVEEYLGTDMRQYLEDFFEDEAALPPDGEEIREHYIQILMNIEDVVEGLVKGLEARRLNRRSLQERVDRLREMIRRENKTSGGR